MRLTKEQAVIVSGYTGYLCCPFSALHADVEKRLGRPIFTHEFAGKEMSEKVKELYRPDFLAICTEDTPVPA